MPRLPCIHHACRLPQARNGCSSSRAPGAPRRDRGAAHRVGRRRASDKRHEAPLATDEQLARVHPIEYVRAIRDAAPERGTVHLDPDTAMNPHTLNAALRAAGAAVLASIWCSTKKTLFRVLQRAAARPPRLPRAADGLLHLQQRRRGGAPRAAGARPRARRDHRLRRAPRQRHRGHLRGRPAGADGVDLPAPVLSVQRHRRPGAQHGQRAARRRRGLARVAQGGAARCGCRRWRSSGRSWCCSPPASTRTSRTTWRCCASSTPTTPGSPQQVKDVAERHADGRIVSVLEGGYALSRARPQRGPAHQGDGRP